MDLAVETSKNQDTNELRIKRSSLGECRVACGFELASYAIPTRFDSTNQASELLEKGHTFLGEGALYKEIYGALLPLLESIPDGASLILEYHFFPLSEGIVGIKTFVLIETPAAAENEAQAEAIRLRTEPNWPSSRLPQAPLS